MLNSGMGAGSDKTMGQIRFNGEGRRCAQHLRGEQAGGAGCRGDAEAFVPDRQPQAGLMRVLADQRLTVGTGGTKRCCTLNATDGPLPLWALVT